MILPKPSLHESRKDWIKRAMKSSVMKSEFPQAETRKRVASQVYLEHEAKTANTRLRDMLIMRNTKQTPFGWGIMTADRHVKNLQEQVGLDVCYTAFSNPHCSFNDVMQKASKTLVYSNEDMVLLEKQDRTSLSSIDSSLLPKNMLMAFSHVLTTPRVDRDNDILHTRGAEVDPNMIMLWQHCHSCPIGRKIAQVLHDDSKIILISALVDINELAHDAAVMVDNDMARFSHGFRPLKFKLRDEDNQDMFSGFEIERFEIMEESIVSVPSNVDAQVLEVIVSLVEGGKLTSAVMKRYAKTARSKMPLLIPSGIDLKGPKNETRDAKDNGEHSKAEGTGSSSTSEKADEGSAGSETTEDAKDTKEVQQVEEKQGRRFAQKTIDLLKDVCEDLDEVSKDAGISRGSKALVGSSCKRLQELIESGNDENDGDPKQTEVVEKEEIVFTVKEATSIFLSQANAAEIKHMLDVLTTMHQASAGESLAKEFRSLTGRSKA